MGPEVLGYRGPRDRSRVGGPGGRVRGPLRVPTSNKRSVPTTVLYRLFFNKDCEQFLTIPSEISRPDSSIHSSDGVPPKRHPYSLTRVENHVFQSPAF